VLAGCTPDKPPNVGGEGTELLLHLQEGAGVLHRAFDLAPVAHDARIHEKQSDAVLVETGHQGRVKAREGPAVSRPLLEDGQPAQARLGPFEDEKLKQGAVVKDGYAPLAVVVSHIIGVSGDPGAALHVPASHSSSL